MQQKKPSHPAPSITIVEMDGVRLDRATADWRGLSRAAVLRLLDQGVVSVNGRQMTRANKGDLLRFGDQIELDPAYRAGEVPRADASIELSVLAEGDGWLVIDKPAGMPVRPHALDETGTVLNAVVAQRPEVVGVGEGGLRSGIVHRLDNDTSGALLIATRQEAWHDLREAFSQHRISKHYVALLHGSIRESGEAIRDLRIAKHQPAYVQVAPQGCGREGSRTCSLGWTLIERLGDRATLVDVDLHTGFLHQVRSMMADLGHPVVGDPTYGSNALTITAPRQMLHAKSLGFGQVKAEAPIPDDIQQALQLLGG